MSEQEYEELEGEEAIEAAEHEAESEEQSLLENLQAERDEPGLRALFLGRLLPYKGVQFILRAMSALPNGAG